MFLSEVPSPNSLNSYRKRVELYKAVSAEEPVIIVLLREVYCVTWKAYLDYERGFI